MRLVIVGGKLQGLEAVYLAKKADYEVILIDKDERALAKNLADEFYCLDILEAKKTELIEVLATADFVLPALEDTQVLSRLESLTKKIKVPFVYQDSAYRLSASKLASDAFFAQGGILCPKYWPEGKLPLIAKPSQMSGSQGVQKIFTEEELNAFLQAQKNFEQEWVLQEYIEGDSYSYEVIGDGEQQKALVVTDLAMDESYDCKSVTLPSQLNKKEQKDFAILSEKIASSLSLRGIMDVEVIANKGKLYVLEIDARLPSQTPIAVFHGSGLNMIELLKNVFVEAKGTGEIKIPQNDFCNVLLVHVKVKNRRMTVQGEHVMASARCIYHYHDLWGADEVLTDWKKSGHDFVATLIMRSKTKAELESKWCRVKGKMMREFALAGFSDRSPIKELE